MIIDKGLANQVSFLLRSTLSLDTVYFELSYRTSEGIEVMITVDEPDAPEGGVSVRVRGEGGKQGDLLEWYPSLDDFEESYGGKR